MRMRVLQVSKFFPPVMGGIESVAWELAEGFARAGVDGAVLCAHQRPRTTRERVGAGYEVVRAGSLGLVLSTSMAPAMPLLLRQLARGRQIVHVHMPDPMAAMAVWCMRPEGRLVVHWHSDVIRQRRALRLYQPLQDWLLARADAIVATSPPYAETSLPLQRWRDKVAVVPIGISDDRTAACLEVADSVRRRFRGRRIVFALGRMTYYKGFEVLIDAARALPDDCVVLIGGEGELLEPLRRSVAAAGLAGKVHLPGHVPDHELTGHFAACDVFCMPSTLRAEAYGVAMLEAMVMARPVVAMDIPGSGVPWVNRHGETGFNVPPGDSAALARALRGLLDDAALAARMGQAARARYETEFGAGRMTQRMLALYRGLGAA